MDKLKNFILNNKFNLILLMLYILTVVISLNTHEIWRDEGQVWCIARDLSFIDILKSARVEGHPFLWYLMLYPIAKSGLPVISMQILSFLIILCSVIYFIFKSPFNNIFKTLIIFSAGMLYYLPVISRNYCLIPIFVFLLANLYNKRNIHSYLYIALIILLSQTHILMLGFCLILFLLFACEKISNFIKNKNNISFPYYLIFTGLYFLTFILLYINVSHENTVITTYINRGYTLLYIIKCIIYIFLNKLELLYIFRTLSLMIIISFVLILFAIFKCDKKLFTIFSFSSLYIFFILYKIWFGGIPYQKVYLILLIMLFCAWIIKKEHKENKLLKYSIGFLLIISFIVGIHSVYSDIRYNFSGSKQISEYIKNNLQNEKTFIVIAEPFTLSGISAYLPDTQFYILNNKKYLTFFNFSKNEYGQKPIPENIRYYIVQDDYFLNDLSQYRELLKTNKENISSYMNKEIFTLYEIK